MGQFMSFERRGYTAVKEAVFAKSDKGCFDFVESGSINSTEAGVSGVVARLQVGVVTFDIQLLPRH